MAASLRSGQLASAPSYFLPAPSKLSGHDAVSLLLRKIVGISELAGAPDWIAQYQIPDEVVAADALRKAEEAVDYER